MKLGAPAQRLEVKLTGGGRVLASMTDVGARNIELHGHWCSWKACQLPARMSAIRIRAECCISRQPAGSLMFRLGPRIIGEVVSREKQYQSTLREKPAGNDVELF